MQSIIACIFFLSNEFKMFSHFVIFVGVNLTAKCTIIAHVELKPFACNHDLTLVWVRFTNEFDGGTMKLERFSLLAGIFFPLSVCFCWRELHHKKYLLFALDDSWSWFESDEIKFKKFNTSFEITTLLLFRTYPNLLSFYKVDWNIFISGMWNVVARQLTI